MDEKINETTKQNIENVADSTKEHLQSSKFLPFGTDQQRALAENFRRLEIAGELYPRNVEIIYPPQVTAKYGCDGVVVDIYAILLWIADQVKGDRPELAAEHISIAEEFYAPDGEFDDFDGSLEDDVLEAISEYADEMGLNS